MIHMEYRFKDFRLLQNEKSFPANTARQYLPFDKTVAADVIRFHKSLPGYAPAPLAALQEQSAAFGIKGIYCKDESHLRPRLYQIVHIGLPLLSYYFAGR